MNTGYSCSTITYILLCITSAVLIESMHHIQGPKSEMNIRQCLKDDPIRGLGAVGKTLHGAPNWFHNVAAYHGEVIEY